MIIFERFGQLGNQIFQVAFALTVRSGNETVFIADINQFADCCVLPKGVVNLDSSRSRWVRLMLGSRMLRLAGSCRLIGYIREIHQEDGRVQVRRTRGLFPITFIGKGWFQDHLVASSAGEPAFIIRADVSAAAKRWLEEQAPEKTKIFCHIRRSDYLNWYQRGINVALPLEYYRKGLQMLRERFPGAVLLLVSDDVEFLKLAFSDDTSRIIIEESPEVTLAIMAMCDHGVISNSTFSWWAGFRVAQRGGYVIAPRHWLGWKERRWTPPAIATPAFDWIDVAG